MLEVTSTAKAVIEDNPMLGTRCNPLVVKLSFGEKCLRFNQGSVSMEISAHQLTKLAQMAPDILGKLQPVPAGADVVEMKR